MSEKKLIVVAGPTAVGKTAVSLRLAEHFQTAIVSADSRQIYREMTVGTAKPTTEERGRVTHYFIDTHSVGEDYDAARYSEEALETIRSLHKTHDQVIVCGGSGLYIRALCEGLDEIPAVPDEIRQGLMKNLEEKGLAWLQHQMLEIDPETFGQIDQQNPHRLIRALEVKLYTGKSILAYRTNTKRKHLFEIVKIGLDLPREELYARIDERMDQMIADGLFEEAHRLYPFRNFNALQTVGYQEIFGFIENAYDLEECVRLLKRNSRRYAKRQLTWFRKDPEFTWFNPRGIDAIIAHIERK
ncbi:MAG: tRNA (adenosine(37)-N6)-dimethylallyltransferase MiaA [Chryseosolibacter sp.]